MASLYYDLNPTIDGIDVDRLSMPNSPTMPSRAVKGMPGPGSDDGDGGGRGGGSVNGGDNGLGSLADELAALDFDSEEEDEEEEEEDEGYEGNGHGQVGHVEDTESGGEEESDETDSQEEADKVEAELNSHLRDDSGSTNGRPRSNTATSATNGHSRTKSKASTISSPKSPRTKRRSGQSKHHITGSLSANLQGALDSGDDDDFIEEYEHGVSPSLQHRLDQIEKLAVAGKQMKFGRSAWSQSRSGGYAGMSSHRHGGFSSLPRIQGDDSDELDVDDEVIPRLMDGLQKLQPQSTLETGVSRLSTVNSALSNHIYNQTRTLRDLTLSLNSSNITPNFDADSEEDEDEDQRKARPPKLSELVLSLIEIIPRPAEVALYELHVLEETTTQLIAQLSFLSDSLHMARQNTIAAGRKLRVAKEACSEWKGQLDLAEKGAKWIEEGDWVGKCSRREAASVCDEVLRGFERTCIGIDKQMEGWVVD